MKRTLIVALDVDDTPDQDTVADADITDGLRARLDEFYADNEVLIPTNIRISVMNPDAVATLLDAADVGLEGAGDNGADELDVTHAGQIVDALRATEAR